MNLVLFVLFITPPVFQLIVGSKATKPSYPFKFWKVCFISFLGLVVATLLNVALMTKMLKLSGSKDGLPVVTILILESIIGSIMILMILIQLFLKHQRRISTQKD